MKIKNPKDLMRFDVAQAILAADTYHTQKEMLDYWREFVPYGIPYMTADEGEVSFVESRYETLRQYAHEWLVEQRLLAIEARLEALENSDSVEHGRLR